MNTQTRDFSSSAAETGEALSGISADPPLTILPELENLLPPLTPSESADLRRSIESEGVRDRLLVWRTVSTEGKEVRILIDGHNRCRIAESLGQPAASLPVSDIRFADLEEAKRWIIANQLMRRNLTNAQRKYFRGLVYESTKAAGFKGNQHTESGSGQNDHKQNTAEKLADQFGVSEKTIRRDAAFARKVDALEPEEKAAVLQGEAELPREIPAAKSEGCRPALSGTPKTFSPDDIKAVTFLKPGDSLLLVYRAITRAEEYLESLRAVTQQEREALIQGGHGLTGILNALLSRIDNLRISGEEISVESSSEDAADTCVSDTDSDF